ncbi:MAG: hypothetical protein OEZ43_12115 [Gammaproteobacteria bacterium]|nr:hypothetical protein [Gammaproteobacteria bacterium]
MQKSAKVFHPAEKANLMRDKAMKVALRRKEEFLGARVPKALKTKVIQRADELGIPVSLLLRRVLEDVFLEEQPSIKLDLIKKNTPQVESKNEFADVIAWKTIVLNRRCSCDSCGEPMQVGERAEMGICQSSSQTPIVCESCQKNAVNGHNA